MLELNGAYTAIATPFINDDARSIDYDGLDRLLEHQIAGGITGIVPCGTTGESPALSSQEQAAIIKHVARKVKGRAQVIAGAGSNSTRGAIAMAKAAEEAGADAIMVVVPYYNKPSQPGLYAHFKAVASAVRAPVIVYNIPGRTGIDLAADTMVSLFRDVPNIVGTKEATGNVMRAQELLSATRGELVVLSGDDGLTVPMMSVGAKGVISVTSNVLPNEVSEVVRLAHEGEFAKATRLHLALLAVHQIMFVESNPAPIKAALAKTIQTSPCVRMPMAEASASATEKVLAALKGFESAKKDFRG